MMGNQGKHFCKHGHDKRWTRAIRDRYKKEMVQTCRKLMTLTSSTWAMMTIGTRIAIAKQSSCEVWHYMTALLNNDNLSILVAQNMLCTVGEARRCGIAQAQGGWGNEWHNATWSQDDQVNKWCSNAWVQGGQVAYQNN